MSPEELGGILSRMRAQLDGLEICVRALLNIARITHRTDATVFDLATKAIEKARQSQQESLSPGNIPTQSQ